MRIDSLSAERDLVASQLRALQVDLQSARTAHENLLGEKKGMEQKLLVSCVHLPFRLELPCPDPVLLVRRR